VADVVLEMRYSSQFDEGFFLYFIYEDDFLFQFDANSRPIRLDRIGCVCQHSYMNGRQQKEMMKCTVYSSNEEGG